MCIRSVWRPDCLRITKALLYPRREHHPRAAEQLIEERLAVLDKTAAMLHSRPDDVVASLQVLMALQAAGGDLAALRAGITMYPQTMINVPVSGKVNLADFPRIGEAVAAVEQRLGSEGRVLLRPSGTEPKVRVMVEGARADEVEQLCTELAAEVRRILS